MATKLKKTIDVNGTKYRLISKHGKKNLANKKESRLREKGYNVRIYDRKQTLGIYAIYARKRANASKKPLSSIQQRVQSAVSKAQSKRDTVCRVSAGVLATKSQRSRKRRFPPSPRKIKKYRGVTKKMIKEAGGTLSGYCSPTARTTKGKRKRFTSYNQKQMGKRKKMVSKARKIAKRNLRKKRRK